MNKESGVQAIPAAQYLRMSTEHQKYSLPNQLTTNQSFAELNGFHIVKDYADSGKSGLDLKHRNALKQLISDVLGGKQDYKVVLVYDISRWGRFQDHDEPAYYEFLCRSAGVQVHYCAELFRNDGTLASAVMKALKRAMAAEYSRELGVKVRDAQVRGAQLGFKQGGVPGYGLRRMLLSPDRKHKRPLGMGEWKSLASERVILVPGPEHEVAVVRDIFRMLLEDKKKVGGIARELNRRNIPFLNGWKWRYKSVEGILTHPKYMGYCVYGRSSHRLRGPFVTKPKSEWVLKPGAYEAIIDPAGFERAQRILKSPTIQQSDEELLDKLRNLLSVRGELTKRIIKQTPGLASVATYRNRFGGLIEAYKRIGYDGHSVDSGFVQAYCRQALLRQRLFARIIELFPEEMSIKRRRSRRSRELLQVADGPVVSVILARTLRRHKGEVWRVRTFGRERRYITLVARLTRDNEAFEDFWLYPNLQGPGRKQFHLRRGREVPFGKRVVDLANLLEVIREIRGT